MKNTILIFMICCNVYAGNTIKVNGEKYQKVKDQSLNAFSISECIKESQEFYQDKTYSQLNQLCCEAFAQLLFDKSEKYGKLVTGIYVDGQCKEKWLKYKN